jgi:tetratricopeptide (TPR) repeat protein
MSKKPKRKQPKDEVESDDAVFADARNMEELLAHISNVLGEQQSETVEEANAFLDEFFVSGEAPPIPEPDTPLGKAQAIIYDAWEADTRRQRVRLARKALKISPDCADAYVLLAEESAETVEEAKELYEAGVEAGERAIGREGFKEYEGHFWGVLETRPYMRARQGLAICLWQMGQRDEAIAHYEEMLRLNPGDNQGVRYALLSCLLEAGREKDAEQLLKRYKDDAAAIWLYNSALLAFRKGGASRRANKQLREAIEFNPHVPDYLLGRRRVPQEAPPYIQLGGDTEAVDYVIEASHLWLQQPGAIEWLREVASRYS